LHTITINHRDSGQKTYNIYTKDEADKEDISYKPWKEGEEGDFVLSDDGFCAKVLKKKIYPNQNGSESVYLRLPWGYHIWNTKYPGKKFNAEGRRTPHTLTGKSQLEVRAGQDKMKNLATAYAQTFDWNIAIDMAIGSTTPGEHRKYKRWMKSEVFKKMVREELQRLLQDHGITEAFVMDEMVEAFEVAKKHANKSGNMTNWVRLIENAQDLHGMRTKQVVKTTTQLEATSTSRMLDEIEEEERKLIAKKVEVAELPEEK
jgi:hypothetical protein|tara:strand:+ start:13776 stop:14555 length:780 start_codon:yes stop_codon:yes gene_type:complete